MSIEVDIRHRAGDFSLEVRFVVDAPGVTALFGPSGAGKSTVVAAVAGLLRPNHGRIAVDDDVLLDTVQGVNVAAHRRRVGCILQNASLFPHLSVRANLLYGWRRAARRGDGAEIDHVVGLLGVGHLMDRRPATLSGGERQRVALGRAMLAGGRALLLDEPLSALDARRKDEIMPYLQRIRDEARIPILYVSHSVDEVTRLADRMIVLADGRIAAEGAMFDVMARPDLFPLTGRFEAGAVLEGRVAAHDPADGLSEIAFDGGRLVVPQVDDAVGRPIRVRVRARDIVLARRLGELSAGVVY
ncbi:MAG: molybdenum ABC transporter ATP-binding protein, partial [Acetobacterales bacterium]